MKKLVIVLSLVFGTSAFANDAGCGLGSLIFKSNGKLSQLFASTTNWSTASQALGITFGTSNCTASGLVQNDKQIQYFVEVNKEDLSREMAQGHGEKLTTLAVLNGCVDKNQVQSFSAFTQKNYGNILPTAKTSGTEMFHNMKSVQVAQQCHGS